MRPVRIDIIHRIPCIVPIKHCIIKNITAHPHTSIFFSSSEYINICVPPHMARTPWLIHGTRELIVIAREPMCFIVGITATMAIPYSD